MTDTSEPSKLLNEEEEYDKKVFGYEGKKPLTHEDLDRGFSLAWVELFKQKRELEILIKDNFERQNDILKLILKELRGLKHE